jgi:hypothetical protein
VRIEFMRVSELGHCFPHGSRTRRDASACSKGSVTCEVDGAIHPSPMLGFVALRVGLIGNANADPGAPRKETCRWSV